MKVTERKYTDEEVGQLADPMYYQDILPKVIEEHYGKYLMLNFETGQYEIDEDDEAAFARIRAYSSPEALVLYRIGFRAATKLGGWGRTPPPMREIDFDPRRD